MLSEQNETKLYYHFSLPRLMLDPLKGGAGSTPTHEHNTSWTTKLPHKHKLGWTTRPPVVGIVFHHSLVAFPHCIRLLVPPLGRPHSRTSALHNSHKEVQRFQLPQAPRKELPPLPFPLLELVVFVVEEEEELDLMWDHL